LHPNKQEDMLIVPVKEGENIERALKKYKKKFDRTGVIKQLRARKQFDKPSVVMRKQKLKAIYVNKVHGDLA
jgi:small subunit ribosomal protein S21|tara:strand:- start:279 stop:494 length:216 start_codon:yes stop_codon:yes gene_type:complete